jgi:hypothetical protein
VTIVVHQRPDEPARTPEKSCVYVAECAEGGVPYSARSRHGASHELARVLMAAGIPDDAMTVTSAGLKGEATWPSFHAMARWTYEETRSRPLHRARWEDPALKAARFAAASGRKQASAPKPATPAPAEVRHAKQPDPVPA